jgi:hypothetical protein
MLLFPASRSEIWSRALHGRGSTRVGGVAAVGISCAACRSRRDTDHVLAVYKANGRWGAVAKSDYSGLRSREPVYKNIRELAMSYFEHYFNLAGEKTLRAFSRPVNLSRFDRTGWMTVDRHVWEIPTYLCEIPHTQILTPPMIRSLARMDQRLYNAGRLGGAKP